MSIYINKQDVAKFFEEHNYTRIINLIKLRTDLQLTIFEYSLQYGHIEIIQKILNTTKINPAMSNNYPLRVASDNGYFEILKLLLTDKRVDPTVFNNQAIIIAYQKGYTNIILLLWKNKNVKELLKKEHNELYNFIKKHIIQEEITNKINNF
jgi:hypothetical protein